MTYRGYHIMAWAADRFSIYNNANSMYDCRDGFKSIEEAKKFIDERRA